MLNVNFVKLKADFFENFLKVAIFKGLRVENFFWKMFWTDFWKFVKKRLKYSVYKGLKGFWKIFEKMVWKNILKKILDHIWFDVLKWS